MGGGQSQRQCFLQPTAYHTWHTSGRAAVHSSNVSRRPRAWQYCAAEGRASREHKGCAVVAETTLLACKNDVNDSDAHAAPAPAYPAIPARSTAGS